MSKFSLIHKTIDENPNITIEHDLYNDQNVLITKQQIQMILQKCEIDYKISDIELFQRAFTHKSYIKKEDCVKIVENTIGALELQEESYERLEFLGDSVVGLIVVEYLYERFFDQNEGAMTRYKSNLVNKEALASFSRWLQLQPFVIISKQIETNHGRENDSILEDVFEAFMGALYLDCNENEKCKKTGFEICSEFMLYILENEVDIEKLVIENTNYKDQLLKYYHHNFQMTPVYKKLISYDSKLQNIAVLDQNGQIFATATAKTKKKAEQLASKKALEKLNIVDNLI